MKLHLCIGENLETYLETFAEGSRDVSRLLPKCLETSRLVSLETKSRDVLSRAHT